MNPKCWILTIALVVAVAFYTMIQLTQPQAAQACVQNTDSEDIIQSGVIVHDAVPCIPKQGGVIVHD